MSKEYLTCVGVAIESLRELEKVRQGLTFIASKLTYQKDINFVIDRLSVQIENLKMSLSRLNDQGSKLKEENEFLKECLTDAFKHSQLLQEIAQQHKLKQVA